MSEMRCPSSSHTQISECLKYTLITSRVAQHCEFRNAQPSHLESPHTSHAWEQLNAQSSNIESQEALHVPERAAITSRLAQGAAVPEYPVHPRVVRAKREYLNALSSPLESRAVHIPVPQYLRSAAITYRVAQYTGVRKCTAAAS